MRLHPVCFIVCYHYFAAGMTCSDICCAVMSGIDAASFSGRHLPQDIVTIGQL